MGPTLRVGPIGAGEPPALWAAQRGPSLGSSTTRPCGAGDSPAPMGAPEPQMTMRHSG
jgi:hypothetical protein